MTDRNVIGINFETLMQAYEVFNQLADNFGQLPEETINGAAAALQCRIAGSYALQLASHIQGGMEPCDAILTVARGDT